LAGVFYFIAYPKHNKGFALLKQAQSDTLAVMPMGDTINKPNTYTMATTLNYVNNYAKFKEDFKKDTGLDASKNVAEYINYFNARMADMNYQMNFQLANQYLNEINLLPGNIALRTAESLKQLIKNLPK